MKMNLFFADLTHTANGFNAPTFSLGIALVMANAIKKVSPDYNCKLFRFPETLVNSIRKVPPRILAISAYSWNFQLGYAIVKWAKTVDSEIICVFGGPNFPVASQEKQEFLQKSVNR